MKFPDPPIRTPFRDDKEGNGIAKPWIQWLQRITTQLSTANTPVTGSKAGNAALTSLIAILVSKGVITDQSTP